MQTRWLSRVAKSCLDLSKKKTRGNFRRKKNWLLTWLSFVFMVDFLDLLSQLFLGQGWMDLESRQPSRTPDTSKANLLS